MKAHTDNRWRAVVTYRSSETGPVDVEYFIEELGDIEDIVERGPDWNAIENITITLSRTADYSTLEEAAAA